MLPLRRISPFLALLFLPLYSEASQRAKAATKSVNIYQSPDIMSPVITTLKLGTMFRISSKPIPDQQGHFWYKTQAAPGTYGYVFGNDIETPDLKRELASGGISSGPVLEPILPPVKRAPEWVLRGMTLGEVALSNGTLGLGEKLKFQALFPSLNATIKAIPRTSDTCSGSA